MLSAVAGALTSHGIAIRHAGVHTRSDGMALEVLRVQDPFDRLESETQRDRVGSDVIAAIAGEIPVQERVAARAQRYEVSRRASAPPRRPTVEFFPGASDFATVVEVHADDEIGLLFRITQVMLRLGLDVRLAKVATIGNRIVDVFYLLDTLGARLGPEQQQGLRTELLAELGAPPPR
jgi:[protein-PII] uridylyltransferase